MANILQDKRELSKLSTAIKNYCGININESLTVQQMANYLNQAQVVTCAGTNAVNQVETITYLDKGEQGTLERVEDLTYLASVIRSKANISQKLAVPQMTYLVSNFRKNQYFYAQSVLHYYNDSDYWYQNSDYYLTFSWNNDYFYPIEWNCWNNYEYYDQGITLITDYTYPGNFGNIYFTFDSNYTYNSPLYVYLNRQDITINTLRIDIDNITCIATVTASYYNPGDDSGDYGEDCNETCGGFCGGGDNSQEWTFFQKEYYCQTNYGTSDGEVQVSVGGNTLYFSSSNYCQITQSCDLGMCDYAEVSAEFTEPAIPEGAWEAKIIITIYAGWGQSYDVNISSQLSDQYELFVCDCLTAK